jgi:hypothetical protein
VGRRGPADVREEALIVIQRIVACGPAASCVGQKRRSSIRTARCQRFRRGDDLRHPTLRREMGHDPISIVLAGNRSAKRRQNRQLIVLVHCNAISGSTRWRKDRRRPRISVYRKRSAGRQWSAFALVSGPKCKLRNQLLKLGIRRTNNTYFIEMRRTFANAALETDGAAVL